MQVLTRRVWNEMAQLRKLQRPRGPSSTTIAQTSCSSTTQQTRVLSKHRAIGFYARRDCRLIWQHNSSERATKNTKNAVSFAKRNRRQSGPRSRCHCHRLHRQTAGDAYRELSPISLEQTWQRSGSFATRYTLLIDD